MQTRVTSHHKAMITPRPAGKNRCHSTPSWLKSYFSSDYRFLWDKTKKYSSLRVKQNSKKELRMLIITIIKPHGFISRNTNHNTGLLIHLKDRVTEREKENENVLYFHLLLHSQLAARVRTGPGWSKSEAKKTHPTWVAGAQYLGHLLLLSRHTSRGLDQKWKSQDLNSYGKPMP